MMLQKDRCISLAVHENEIISCSNLNTDEPFLMSFHQCVLLIMSVSCQVGSEKSVFDYVQRWGCDTTLVLNYAWAEKNVECPHEVRWAEVWEKLTSWDVVSQTGFADTG